MFYSYRGTCFKILTNVENHVTFINSHETFCGLRGLVLLVLPWFCKILGSSKITAARLALGGTSRLRRTWMLWGRLCRVRCFLFNAWTQRWWWNLFDLLLWYGVRCTGTLHASFPFQKLLEKSRVVFICWHSSISHFGKCETSFRLASTHKRPLNGLRYRGDLFI